MRRALQWLPNAVAVLIFIASALGEARLALAEEPIRLGAALQLSGPLASYGNLIKGGIELAAADLQKEGIETRLFFEDVPVVGAHVVTGFNKLIQSDHVDGIAGNFSNAALSSVAPILEKERVIAFSSAAMDPALIDPATFVVSTNVRIKDEAEAMAEHLVNGLRLKRAAVLSIQTGFGQAYRNFFISRFKALGGTVVSDESFELTDADFKSQLLKIRHSEPHAIYAACFGPFLGRALKHGRELGLKAPFFSVYESEDSSVLDAAGASADGLRYFVTASESSNPKFKEFRLRYLDRYHVEPGTFASNSYDATMILGHALHKCRRERSCALREIYGIQGYPGVSGTFSIQSDGAAQKSFVLRTVRAGKFSDSLEPDSR